MHTLHTHIRQHVHVMRLAKLHPFDVSCNALYLQAARDGKTDSGREALRAQMMVLHLRSRIQKELGMQVRHSRVTMRGRTWTILT